MRNEKQMKLCFYPYDTPASEPDSYFSNIQLREPPVTGNCNLYQVYRFTKTLWRAMYNWPGRTAEHKMRVFRSAEEAMMFCKLLFEDLVDEYGTDGLHETGELDSVIELGRRAAEGRGLGLPMVFVHSHCNRKHRRIEGKVEKQKNIRLTELLHGSFLCDHEDDAEILKKHGWRVELEEQPRKTICKHEGRVYDRRYWLCKN